VKATKKDKEEEKKTSQKGKKVVETSSDVRIKK
jgi:hypothetical protein